MKSRTILSFCALLVIWAVLMPAAESYADKREIDEITQAIQQNKSRWSAKDTSFSKLTADERKKRLGALLPISSAEVKTLETRSASLPLKLDWRDYDNDNYVTSVKDQGACGACWAFATTAALESKVLIAQNTPGSAMDLSEQLLTSCSGAGSCYAGSIGVASDFLCNFGLPPESFYPYAAADGPCLTAGSGWEANAYKIPGWSLVNPTAASIKSALYNYGPLVALMVVQTDFYYYGSGIYTYSWGSFEGYHAALIIGYDDIEQYFIVKSSWGVDWGENGYFRIAYNEINTTTIFGHWTIAYNSAIASDFQTVDGIARNTNEANNNDASSNDNDVSGDTTNDKENHGQGANGAEGSSNDNKESKDKSSPEDTSNLTGIIRDEAGDAVSDAEIKIGEYVTMTDIAGRYQFLSIPSGDHVVTASKKGYASATANISIPPGTKVTKYFILVVIQLGAANDHPGNKKRIKGPGWFAGNARPVKRAEAEAYFSKKSKERALSTTRAMPMAASAADTSPAIQALARALRYDPKLIYDYIHNSIDYVPYFGALKGATLTLLDGSGNDIDQAALMIALLREGGYNAQYKFGYMRYVGSELVNWLGVDQGQAIQVLTNGGVFFKNYDINGTYATPARVWVTVTINGNTYDFDPAFKSYTPNSGINIGQAMGYSRTELMAAAANGATITTDYVQNLNEGGLRNKLASYASNLVSTIRNQYPNSYVSDIISGRRIVQTTIEQYETTLPHQDEVATILSDVPEIYRAKLTIQVCGAINPDNTCQSPDINTEIETPDLSGERLTITFNAAQQPELRKEGALIKTGANRSQYYLSISINHPYVDEGFANQIVSHTLKNGGNYAIVYCFGGISDILLERRRQQLADYRSLGLSDTSEAVLGETLNIMGKTWLKEVSMSNQIFAALAETVYVRHHHVALMAQEGEGYYIDVKAGYCTTTFKHSGIDGWTFFKVQGLMQSAFEHGMLEQMMGASSASTINLLQIANATGRKVFHVNQANFSTISSQLINYTTSEKNEFQAKVNNGTLVLPDNGQLVMNEWRGKGYIAKEFTADDAKIEMVIGGNYYGGYVSYYQESVEPEYLAPPIIMPEAPPTVFLPVESIINIPSFCGDPVHMGTGAYYFYCTDLKLGTNAPLGLEFSRTYNSSMNREKRVLGYGWTHNNETFLTETSYGDLGLGRRQPLDAAATIAAFYASVDLMRATSTEDKIDYWMTASLVSKWAVDQLVDNVISLYAGDKRMDYVRLANGTYASPPGTTAELIKNGDGTFKLQERFGRRMDFNANKRLSQIVDVDGNAMTFTYGGDKNLTSVRDAFNRTLTISYTGGRISAVTDSASPSRTVSYGYDGNNNLTSYTDPEGKVWGYAYDPNHRMTTMTNPLGTTLVVNAYDVLGQVLTQTYPRQGGATATHNYYFSGYRNALEDNGGRTSVFFYDDQGREYVQQDPLGNKVLKEFDGQGHVTKLTDPRNNFTRYYYDGKHNLTSVVDAANQMTTNIYDALNRLTDITDPLNHNTHFSYDVEHHLTGTLNAAGNSTGATYYPNGLKWTATDGRGAVTTLVYDSHGNPRTATTGSHPAITFAYDASGRMTGLTDQVNSSTGFTYDERSLLTGKTDPLNRTAGFVYDNAGRLYSRTDRNNSTVYYAYTPSNKSDRITYPGGAFVQFNYNNLDNLTSMQDAVGTTSYTQYDAANRLKSVTDPYGFTVGYDYDAAGNVTKITYPGSNRTVSYTYDALNRVETAKIDWLTQTATYHYDAAGRLDYLNHFNGTLVDYGYDNANRLTSLNNMNGATVLAGYSFTLDGNGNRTQAIRDEPLAVQSTAGVTYTYNSKKNRLDSSSADGNFGYDNEGQLNSGYGTSYTFDYEHRVTAIGSAYQFSYDGNGNRRQALRSGVTTRYIYDAAGNLIAEADGGNNITKYYIYGRGLLAMVTATGQLYCYHFDATGNTIAMTDTGGNMVNKYAYGPFGNIIQQVEALTQPFKYVGQYGVMAEPNGFYYMRARYYDPKVGRFISEDPIGFDGGDVNLYAYVQNNPVNGIDPLGLFNVLIGAGGSATAPTGGDLSGGVVINPGLFGQKADAGVFGSAGVATGVNVSGDIFVGLVKGGIENVQGTTANVNLTLGPVSVSIFTDPRTGSLVGGTFGLGPSATKVGASGSLTYTGTLTVRDLLPSSSGSKRASGRCP